MEHSIDPLLGSFGLPGSDGAFWFDKFLGETVAEARAVIGIDAPDGNEPWGPGGEGEPDASTPADEPPARGHRRRRGRGRGRGRSTLTAEERRQKNRQIQARYRENQRTRRAELETSHAQAAEDLYKARGEHAATAHRNALLEKRLAVRDTAVAILERGRSGDGRSNAVSDSQSDGAIEESQETQEDNASGDHPSSTSAGSVPRPVVHSLYKQFSTGLGAPVESIADAYDAAERLERHAEMALENPQYAEVMSAVQTMTGHQLVQGWRSFALQVRDLLEHHERTLTGGAAAASSHWSWDDVPPLLTKVEPLFQEQVVVLSTALRYNLPAVETLFGTASDIGPDPAAFWRGVARSMGVTPAQREKLAALWRAHASRVAALRAARIAVVESLAQGEGGVTGDGACPVGTLRAMMSRYLNLFDASGKLAAIPDTELAALIDTMRDTGKVWTMLQRAKMVALSYPAFPDTVAFLRAVAEMPPEELAPEEAAPGDAQS